LGGQFKYVFGTSARMTWLTYSLISKQNHKNMEEKSIAIDIAASPGERKWTFLQERN
jgi:hypothetical protein